MHHNIDVGQKKNTLYLELCELASMHTFQLGVPYDSHVPSSTEEGRLIEYKEKAIKSNLCKTTEKSFMFTRKIANFLIQV